MSEKTDERVGEILVDPELVKFVREAAAFYENVADGEWLVFNRPKLRYFQPDLKAMRDKANRLNALANEMQKIYTETKSG